MTKKSTLLIVAGAAGEIGTEFCKKAITAHIDCIGVIRNKKTGITSKYFQEITCHLEDSKQIEKVFASINFNDYQQIIYLHTIGVDKFDPRGYPHVRAMDTIDPGVYNTNVNSFKYLLRYCIKTIHNINLVKKGIKIKFRCVVIAGVADKHTPFVIESFCEAKFIVRQYIQSYVNLYSKWVSGLSINVSSTVTKSALQVRPHADTKYWLTPKNVVDRSFKALVSKAKSYNELDIYKHSPEFVHNYYIDNDMLYKKWSKETGIF